MDLTRIDAMRDDTHADATDEVQLMRGAQRDIAPLLAQAYTRLADSASGALLRAAFASDEMLLASTQPVCTATEALAKLVERASTVPVEESIRSFVSFYRLADQITTTALVDKAIDRLSAAGVKLQKAQQNREQRRLLKSRPGANSQRTPAPLLPLSRSQPFHLSAARGQRRSGSSSLATR